MKWAGHMMVGLKGERLPKRSETNKQKMCRKRGRPKLRWENSVKRDLKKAEEANKVERKSQHHGTMETNYKSIRTSDN